MWDFSVIVRLRYGKEGGCNVKERIKAIRKHPDINLNQEEFGKRVGVKGNTIGNYELGLRNPSEAVIFSICREFNVNEDWLRTGNGDMFNPMSEDEELDLYIGRISGSDDVFKKNLLKALCKLTDEEWNVLKKIVQDIKEG